MSQPSSLQPNSTVIDLCNSAKFKDFLSKLAGRLFVAQVLVLLGVQNLFTFYFECTALLYQNQSIYRENYHLTVLIFQIIHGRKKRNINMNVNKLIGVTFFFELYSFSNNNF
eukprot:TRINITY_DN42125_c0_g1_i1.p3 TRINITY_DN42125_c0_g1~~TRINITY_DN42125_c0_g1_i1.p3  ORF type:complete len:112 (+),score=4.93 TRINITY_DN42125_c0_g1_i1:74-409(+)